MSNPKLVLLKSSSNSIEAIRQFVQTVCIFSFRDVTMRELDLLCELLRCGGVNDKAKKGFLVNYKTTKENYGQLVKRLSDKGILINNEMRNGKKLHQTFIEVMELYTNNPTENHMLIRWKTDL